MVDSTIGHSTDDFYKAKSNFIKTACEQLQKWKNTGNKIKIICQDNMDKNKLFEQRTGSSVWTLVMKFEYMAHATLQHNA